MIVCCRRLGCLFVSERHDARIVGVRIHTQEAPVLSRFGMHQLSGTNFPYDSTDFAPGGLMTDSLYPSPDTEGHRDSRF